MQPVNDKIKYCLITQYWLDTSSRYISLFRKMVMRNEDMIPGAMRRGVEPSNVESRGCFHHRPNYSRMPMEILMLKQKLT